MPAPDTITVAQLARLVGTPDAPIIVDVRSADDHAAEPRMLPASTWRDYRTVSAWAGAYASQPIAVVSRRGQKLAQGTAAWLRHAGARAEYLEGGFEAWRATTTAAPCGSRVLARRSIASPAPG